MAAIEALTFEIEPAGASQWLLEVRYQLRFFPQEDQAWFSETIRLGHQPTGDLESVIIGSLRSGPFRVTVPVDALEGHVVERHVPAVGLKEHHQAPPVHAQAVLVSFEGGVTASIAVAGTDDQPVTGDRGVTVGAQDRLFVTADIEPVPPRAASHRSASLPQPFGRQAVVELSPP